MIILVALVTKPRLEMLSPGLGGCWWIFSLGLAGSLSFSFGLCASSPIT